MTIEGYFDGTVVRSLEPLHLKPQQKVFIHIPNSDFSDAKKERIESGKKVAAVDERYFYQAEELLYEELAYALEMDVSQVGDYISDKIGK